MPRDPVTTQPDTDAPPKDSGGAWRIADHLRIEHGDNAGGTEAGLHGHHDGIHGRTWAYRDQPEHHWRWASDAPQEGRPAMSDPKFVRDNRPLRWRIWWRFGFIPIVRIIGWLPIPEWRRDAWVRAVDIWSMDMNRRLDR
jgi:hypothetical protein